jgi:predicted RecA/RadA family phage recombinase
MATNEVFEDGDNLSIVCSDPTTPTSGSPVRYGEMAGVAMTDEQTDGYTSVTFKGVHLLSVKGVDGGGNSAVAVGDKLFYTDADTPKINKKTTGRPIGFAVSVGTNAGTVSSGGTSTIPVRLATF